MIRCWRSAGILTLGLAGIFLCLPRLDANETNNEFLSTLTLNDAIARAIEQSPMVREAEITADLVEIDLRATTFWRSLLESLRLGLQGGYDLVFGDSRTWIGVGIELGQIVRSGHEHTRAGLRHQAARLRVETLTRQVATEATKRFIEYRQSLGKVALLEATLADSAKLAKVAEVRFETGQMEFNQFMAIQQTMREDAFALQNAMAERDIRAAVLRELLGMGNTQ